LNLGCIWSGGRRRYSLGLVGGQRPVPGFSAAADHLPDLLSRARDVIREEKILPDEANITVLLVPIEHHLERPL